MAEVDNGLFAIEVDADDYGETAAADAPPVPRTFQSETKFQAVKDAYNAKIDVGNNYKQLLDLVPLLRLDQSPVDDGLAAESSSTPVKLGKRDCQLLGYAVGELYYDREYAKAVELCERVTSVCQMDAKTLGSLQKWAKRCELRLAWLGATGEPT
ncbi:hypothetical protein LTR08_003465 [Meristemomyces frigidus]|nr:hypothetical protein LTR08_003465 [Meristemomyces frigidus]